MERYTIDWKVDNNNKLFAIAEPDPRGAWVVFTDTKCTKRFRMEARYNPFELYDDPVVVAVPDENGEWVPYHKAIEEG